MPAIAMSEKRKRRIQIEIVFFAIIMLENVLDESVVEKCEKSPARRGTGLSKVVANYAPTLKRS